MGSKVSRAALLVAVSIVLTGAMCKRKMRKIPEYRRELWTAEADENLDRIYQGLVRLWNRAKDKDNFRFPSAGPTPPQVPCGTKPHPPDPKLWDAPGWKAIGFSLEEPFRYQYQVVSQGQGRRARFRIRVRGDLDCDGDYSLFELRGAIDAKGRVTDLGGKQFDEDRATE